MGAEEGDSLMEQTSRIVTVDIHGQRYPDQELARCDLRRGAGRLRGREDAAGAQECPSGDTLKVAVLAALNIADEYFRAGDEVQDRQDGFAHRARALERMLDMALASGPRSARRGLTHLSPRPAARVRYNGGQEFKFPALLVMVRRLV